MIYNKKIAPYCEYCAFGSEIDDIYILCQKKGPVEATDSCKKFRYDPLKRKVPNGLLKTKIFKMSDFDLEDQE